MPQEIAATWSFSTFETLVICRASIQARQSCSAIQPPVIEAVRVPPSAWMTSQSTVICCSPSACRSTTARSERPISRWISSVLPPCLPDDASRRMRSPVERGSMPYSAVTQPLPELRIQPGTFSSRLAVHSTCVSPNLTRQDPSACLEMPRSKEIGAHFVGLPFRWTHWVVFLSGIRGAACSRMRRAAQRKTPPIRGGMRQGCVTARPDYILVDLEHRSEAMPKTDMDQALQTLDARSRDIFRTIVDSYLQGRRAGRFAQPVAAVAARPVAGDDPQRDERPRASRPRSMRRTSRPAGCRRSAACASSSTPSWRSAISPTSERRAIEAQVKASGSGASLEHMLTEASQMLSGMSRGAGVVRRRQERGAAEAHRVHPARADQGADRAGLAERRRREPHRRAAGRHHRVATAGSVEFPQRPYPRPHAGRGQGGYRQAQGGDQGRARHAVAASWSKRGSPSGPAPKAACRPGSSCAAAPTCWRTSRRRPTSSC